MIRYDFLEDDEDVENIAPLSNQGGSKKKKKKKRRRKKSNGGKEKDSPSPKDDAVLVTSTNLDINDVIAHCEKLGFTKIDIENAVEDLWVKNQPFDLESVALYLQEKEAQKVIANLT